MYSIHFITALTDFEGKDSIDLMDLTDFEGKDLTLNVLLLVLVILKNFTRKRIGLLS